MAITWGETQSYVRVGIDIVVTSETSTTLNYQVRWYVQAVNRGFDDNQTLTIGGSTPTTDIPYHLYSPWGTTTTIHVATRSFSVTKQYGGGPTHTFTGKVAGIWRPANPYHSRSYTYPARPASPPSAPGTPTASAITGTSIKYDWTAVGSTNGSTIEGYQLLVDVSSAFTPPEDHNSTLNNRSRTVTGLRPGTTYYARVRADSSAGWGSYSGTRVATTLNYPSAPGTPTISDIGPQAATASWAAPSSTGGAAITEYEIQIATQPNFSDAVSAFSMGPVFSRTFTNLEPGERYYVRVRAQNSVGYGAWSGTRSFQTLAGAKVMVNGAWQDAVAYVMVNGEWRLAVVHKRSNDAWVV